VLNTCKVVNRKFDTGISHGIQEALLWRKEKRKERKIRRVMCSRVRTSYNGTMTGIFSRANTGGRGWGRMKEKERNISKSNFVFRRREETTMRNFARAPSVPEKQLIIFVRRYTVVASILQLQLLVLYDTMTITCP